MNCSPGMEPVQEVFFVNFINMGRHSIIRPAFVQLPREQGMKTFLVSDKAFEPYFLYIVIQPNSQQLARCSQRQS